MRILSSGGGIVANAMSVLASDAVNRATTFILYALVARYLGAFAFGQMSLALTFYYLFQVVAVAGLKTLITREVARNRGDTGRHLGNAAAVVVVSSLLSMALLWILVRLMGYSAGTVSLILLISLGLLPYSLAAISEAVLQAWERMSYIAFANVPANVARLGLAYLVMSQGHDLYAVMALTLASQTAAAAAEWWLTLRLTRPVLRVDPHFILTLARSTATFLGIDGIVALRGTLNVLLLSRLAGETEVGLYSAAVQLTVPVVLFYQSAATSVFPIMCRRFDSSLQDLRRVSERLIALLLALALPVAVTLFLMADSALLLLYHEVDFALAAGALRIMSWILICRALTFALGQLLLAGRRERVALRIGAVNVLVSLGAGLVLISQFGVIGAALTALLEALINLIQHYLPVSRLVGRIPLERLVWKPAVAAAAMAAYLVAVREHGLLLATVPGALLYTGIWLALTVPSVGELRQLKAKWSKGDN
ncbi:MAG: flippase [Chloroflexota bacterium]